MKKNATLLLIAILMVSSLIMVSSVFAESIPKPSVPEFNLQYVGLSYDALFVTVKNQPYDSTYGSMYYNLRLKDHNAGDDSWTYPLDHLFHAFDTYPIQSTDSDHTYITITAQSNFLILGTENDIQVQAMLGSITRDARYVPSPYIFNGTKSDWSPTQTIEIPTPSPAPTASPFNEPQLTDQEVIIGVAIVVVVIGAGLGLLIYLIRRK